jgi:2-aminoadipate transaminase
METRIADRALRDWTRLFAERTRAGVDVIAEIMAVAGRSDLISFAGGLPDPRTFPGEAVAEILRDLAASGDTRPFQYGPTEGLASTREYLCDRIERIDGVRPGDGELMITSGGMEGFELLGKALLDAGDVVAVEAPTYLGAIMVIDGLHGRAAAIALDRDGLDPDALEAELRGGLRPKYLYVIPEYQNPAGVTLSAERRHALVDLARRYELLVVEDVAYRELGYDGTILPSLWSLAPETVVQIGTFSKTFMPGTRLGWACGPREVVAKMVWSKQTTDQCASGLAQRLLEEYGRRGLLDEGIARSRGLYARRWERTRAALEREMPDGVEWWDTRGGFFTWLTIPRGDTVELAKRALDEGVVFVPGAPFYADGRGARQLRLAFSLVPEEQIDEGIARLGRLFASA